MPRCLLCGSCAADGSRTLPSMPRTTARAPPMPERSAARSSAKASLPRRRGRLGLSPELRHDFDADEVLGGVLARGLDGEDGVHRGDRDGELVEVGLAGGELLELEAGPHDRADPALAAVVPGAHCYI